MKSDRDNKDKKITGYQVDTEQYEHKADFGKQGQVNDVSIHTKKKKPEKVYAAQGSERDYFAKLIRSLRTAQRENCAQGIIRLFNRANPKTRLGLKKLADTNQVESSLVYSQQVRGFRTLAKVITDEGMSAVLKKINDGFDGKPGGYTGLGRIMILALLTSESDLHLKNIGIDDQGRFVKIDGDWTHGRLRYKELGRDSGLLHKFLITADVLRELPLLNSESAYPYNWFDQIIRGCEQEDCDFLNGLDAKKLRQEVYQAMLDIIITPDRYFEMIGQRSAYDQNDVMTNHLELMNSRLQLMHSALQFRGFLQYVNSNQAQAGLKKFTEDVTNYRLAGKETLGTKAEIAAALQERFKECAAMINMMPGSAEWNDACIRLIDSNSNAFNIHGETHIMLAAAQGNENLYALLVKKGANELAVTHDNETVLSMAALHGHEKLFHQIFHQHKKLREQKYLNVALLAAAKSGNMNILDTLLAGKADINARDSNGNTPLILAAQNGHLELVRLLLKNGANAMLHNKSNLNALSMAALCGHEDTVRLLLRSTNLYQDADNALLCACHGHSSSIIDRLINAGASIHAPNALGQTSIHILAIGGKIDLMKHLLVQGATLDTRDISSRTPLMNAVLTDNLKMLDFILSQPSGLATINHADANGDSALTMAIAKGQWKILVRLLNVKGLNLLQENNQKQTPLTLAYDKNKPLLMDDLIKLGADPHTVLNKKRNETVLFVSARENNTERISNLIAGKCNLEHKNKHGETALFAAIEAKALAAAKQLLGAGAKIDAANNEGVTLLAHAAKWNNAAVIQHLIAAGAEVNQPVPPHYTALTVAMWNSSYDCVEELLANGAILRNTDEVPKELLDKTINELLKRDRADLVYKLLFPCKALDYDLSFSDKGHNLLEIAVTTGDLNLADQLVKSDVAVTKEVVQLAKEALEYYRKDAVLYEPKTTDINQKCIDYQAIIKLLTLAQHKQLTKKPEAVSTGDINLTLTATSPTKLASPPKEATPPPQPTSKGTAYFDKPAATPGRSPDQPVITVRERPTNSTKKK